MGKGAGSVCGKPTPVDKGVKTSSAPEPVKAETAPEQPKPTEPAPAKETAPPATTQDKPEAKPEAITVPQPNVGVAEEKVSVAKEEPTMAKIYIIFYSMYGHVYNMAKAIKEGVDSVEGCEGVLYQVPETLPADVLEKMHAPPKPDVPVISAKDLPDADGFVFGLPTRFGMMAAQMKAFFDTTGSLWQTGALVGKPAGFFISTATQGGGQETTALTAITQLTHHGMIYVPTGYSYGGLMFDLEAAHAGSPYGSGTFAGPTGAAQPTEHDLGYAKHQGGHIAKIAKKLKA